MAERASKIVLWTTIYVMPLNGPTSATENSAYLDGLEELNDFGPVFCQRLLRAETSVHIYGKYSAWIVPYAPVFVRQTTLFLKVKMASYLCSLEHLWNTNKNKFHTLTVK